MYAYDSKYTKFSKRFDVNKRSRPADYVYTETDIKRWTNLEEDIQGLVVKTNRQNETIYLMSEDITNIKEDIGNIESDVENAKNEMLTSEDIDTTLSVSGAAADAKTVGDRFVNIEGVGTLRAETDITKWNYETRLPDMNNASINRIYNINGCL